MQITVASLNKMNTKSVQRIFTKITGREAMSAEDRQMMIAIICGRLEIFGDADHTAFERVNGKAQPKVAFTKVTEFEVKQILRARKAGLSFNEIGKIFERGTNHIRNICMGKFKAFAHITI